MADVGGVPLVSHAAQAIRDLAPDKMIAVARSQAVAELLDGFKILFPPDGADLQSDSLKLGVAAAEQNGCGRVVVVLADMPGITSQILAEIVRRAGPNGASAASDGQTIMPPVCLPASWFPKIQGLSGDRGAASLLQDLPDSKRVVLQPEALRDIDTPNDNTGLR